jgi:hypothetical protein
MYSEDEIAGYLFLDPQRKERHMTPRPRLYLRAGLLSGVLAAALAICVSLALQRLTGNHYDQLSAVRVGAAALLTNVLGGAVYWLLARRTERPARWFGALAMIVAALDTQFVFASPPAHGFAVIAVPLHFIVALVAAMAIPSIVSGRLRDALRPWDTAC